MTSTAPKTSTRPESGGQKRPKGYRPGLLAVVAALMWVVALVGGLMSVDSGSDFPFGWWMAGGLVLLLLDVQGQRRDRGLTATVAPPRPAKTPVENPVDGPQRQGPLAAVEGATPAERGPVRYYVLSTTALEATGAPLSPHFPYDWPVEIRHATIRSHRFTDEERMRRAGIPVGSWQEAEMAAMLWMRDHGHPDAQLTPVGPDGGVDVVAASAIAQVKHYARPVGPRPVRELAGTSLQPQHHRRRATPHRPFPRGVHWASRCTRWVPAGSGCRSADPHGGLVSRPQPARSRKRSAHMRGRKLDP